MSVGKDKLSAYNPFIVSPSQYFRDGSGLLGGEEATLELLKTTSWRDVSKEILGGEKSTDKYKSLALHAEMKLAEALEKCSRGERETLTRTTY